MASIYDRLSFMWGPAPAYRKGFSYASKPITGDGEVPFSRNSDNWVIGKSGLFEKRTADLIGNEWGADGFIGTSFEPASTNSILNPDMTDNWGGASYTKEVTTLGEVPAAKITVNTEGTPSGNSSGRYERSSNGFSHTLGVVQNLSFICRKESSHPFIGFIVFTNGIANSFRYTYNVDTGEAVLRSDNWGLVNHGGKVEQIGPNLFRCSAYFTSTSTGTSDAIGVYIPGALNDNNTGPVGSSFTVTGFNDGLGENPTSPIFITGTRQAGVCAKTGVADLIGQSEGTIWLEGKFNAQPNSRTSLVYLRAASFRGYSINITSNSLQAGSRNDSGQWAGVFDPAYVFGTKVQLVLSYANNKATGFINGVKAFDQIDFFGPSGIISEIRIGYGATAGLDDEVSNSHISFVGLFKEALTDTEIANLPRVT